MDEYWVVLRRESVLRVTRKKEGSCQRRELGLTYLRFRGEQWTSKSYDFNRVIPFPTDLSVIAKAIVHEEIDWKKVYDRVGEAQVGWESWGDYGQSCALASCSFVARAGILNPLVNSRI